MEIKINDLIFRELLKRGYKFEGKTRVWNIADSKLWYLRPKQAQGFLDLTKTQSYKDSIIKKEISLIKSHLSDFVKLLGKNPSNIIDLGCGDGKKASLFLGELSKNTKIRYCPIDISSYMVSKAVEMVRKMNVGEVIEFKWNVSDFENLDNVMPLLRTKNFQNNFLMLLGNTLGNFDKEDILHGIQNSMNKNDILIIGNGLVIKDASKIILPYKDKLLDKFLIEVIKQLGLGKSRVIYNVRFRNSRVEMFYSLLKDKKVNHIGRTIEFKKGDIIIVAISFKYSKKDLFNILSKFFRKVKIYTDKEETYALASCKK